MKHEIVADLIEEKIGNLSLEEIFLVLREIISRQDFSKISSEEMLEFRNKLPDVEVLLLSKKFNNKNGKLKIKSDPRLTAQMKRFVLRGDTIAAIKQLRYDANISLGEARNIVIDFRGEVAKILGDNWKNWQDYVEIES